MGPRPGDGRWISASELGEYAYCPRAWWYRQHPPPGGRSPESERSTRAGVRYHDRALAAEWRRERAGRAYWALLVLAVALVSGGLLWIPGLIRILLAATLVGAGVAIAVGAVVSLLRRRRERRDGALRAVDRSGTAGPTLSAPSLRLTSRPDGLRRLPDGREVPIEIKHRSTPPKGPFRSHRVQVLAYCLLVEATTGRAPPYGLLRYGDGGEFRILWDASARSEVLGLLALVRRPYHGEATPSPGRCAGCGWREGCDARARGIR